MLPGRIDAPGESVEAQHWSKRHPFSVGQTVFARDASVLGSYGLFLTPGTGYQVRMRGEDGHGLWLAVEGVVEQLPERIFSAEPATQRAATYPDSMDRFVQGEVA